MVKTEPAAGTQVKAEQTIKLYISKGPEMKTMPNVCGLSLADAQKKLSDAGFKNYTSDGNTQSGNVVVAQSSEQGTQVDIHKTITLTLGVKKNVTIDWTVEDPAAKTYVKIVRDGVTLVDREFDAGVTQVVLPDQVGSGAVKYLVYIGQGNTEPWEETVNF